MITNVAGEEAESPADPNSELGQMSKKVCFYPLINVSLWKVILPVQKRFHIIIVPKRFSAKFYFLTETS